MSNIINLQIVNKPFYDLVEQNIKQDFKDARELMWGFVYSPLMRGPNNEFGIQLNFLIPEECEENAGNYKMNFLKLLLCSLKDEKEFTKKQKKALSDAHDILNKL